MSIRPNVHSGKCPFWKIDFWGNVHLAKCTFWQMSILENRFSGKCPFGQMHILESVRSGKCIFWQVYVQRNVYSGCLFSQVFFRKCTFWKVFFGEMYRIPVDAIFYNAFYLPFFIFCYAMQVFWVVLQVFSVFITAAWANNYCVL